MVRDNSKSAILARRAEWNVRLRRELERMVALLEGKPGIRRVILFGSLARGQASSRSDLDLVIVQETDKPFMARLDEFYGLLAPRVETDILVYTPEEWDRMRETRHFARRIGEEGVTLYEPVQR